MNKTNQKKLITSKKFKVFAVIGGCLFVVMLGLGLFFILRNNNSNATYQITQATNISSETKTIIEKKGNQVTLTAQDIAGYRFICWQVNLQNISSEKSYTFVIDENTNLVYTAIYVKEYIIFVDSEIQNGSVVSNKFVAVAGEEVALTITPASFYKLKSLQCKQGERDVVVTNNKFVMPDGNVFVYAEFEKEDFLVKIPQTRVGYSITNVDGSEFDTTSVKANQSISFKIILDIEYIQSEYVVRCNGEILAASNNIYTINNITDDIDITIDGIAGINTYIVNLPQTQTGYIITNIDNSDFDESITIEYSGSLSFKIRLDENYLQSADNVVVKNNGIIITAENGIYTIDNITQDVNITVEGVEINRYQVIFPTAQIGYSITNLDGTEFVITSVEYNSSISFRIKLNIEYSRSDNIVVKNNGTIIIAENGIYTIRNITENGNISIDGIELNRYQIILPQTQTGYLITNLDNVEFVMANVEHNCSISFKVVVDESYSQSANNVVVKNNSDVIASNNGVYTIDNITQDVNIIVEGVVINKYQVSVLGIQNGYSIKTVNNTIFTTTTVDHGDSISFKVNLETAYSHSLITVKANGTIVEENSSIYTISNITENVSITVTGVQINSYTITFPEQVIVTKDSAVLTTGGIVYHYDKIVLNATPTEGYLAEFTVSGAELVSGNTYRVVGDVNISYREVEIVVNDASYYQTLTFLNYDDENLAVSVAANTDNRPTGNLEIPYKVRNDNKIYNVTVIDVNGFAECTELRTLFISSYITTIKANAFMGCTKLTTVITDSNSRLKMIEKNAFYDCESLTSILIPNGIESIGDNVFGGCGSSIYNVYDNALYLGNEQNLYVALYAAINTEISSCIIHLKCSVVCGGAFEDCTALNTITIPSNVKNIEIGAFEGCTALANVVFADNSQLTSIGSNVFYDCSSLESITIPDSVTNIGSGAFANCSALAVVNVSSIKNWLNIKFGFIDANPLWNGGYLYVDNIQTTAIEIPNDVFEIKQFSFVRYAYLTSVIISNNVTSVGQYAFYNCTGLTTITIPNSVTTIGNYAFQNCSKLSSINISNDAQLTSIGQYAFYGCALLTSITIPNSVTKIGNYAFQNCSKLSIINISNDAQLTSIGKNAFENCGELLGILIPDNLTTIGNYAFQNCVKLSSVTISINSQLANIGKYAFYGCVLLASIVIPQYVESIGAYAFYDCNVTDVSIYSSNIYNAANKLTIAGFILSKATTIRVLASIVDDVNNSNVFLNNEQNYNKVLTNIDGVDFYVYTKIENN